MVRIMPNFILENYTLFIIVLGTLFLGLVNGVLGVFTVLKKQALVGDALSHATLPGVVLAFMFTGVKDMWVLLLGASISSVVAMLLIEAIKRVSKSKDDALLSLILASFFGVGQVLLLLVQSGGNSTASGLQNFIFGQAATMLLSDVYLIAGVALFVLLLVFLFYKELKLFVFNRDYFYSLGFSSTLMSGLLTLMTVLVVTISIRTVGVILMSAFLIAPSVSSRQWSNKLVSNLFLAGLFGMISGVGGSLISSQTTNLPTGPVIVLFLSLIVVVSLFFAPKRGIIHHAVQLRRHKRDLAKYYQLIHLYEVKEPVLAINLSDVAFLEQELVEIVDDQVTLTFKGGQFVERLLRRDQQ